MESDYEFGYGKEIEALHYAGVQYLVVGGAAMWFHRHPRTTDDLDIIPNLEDENLTKLVDVFRKLNYKPKLIHITLDDFKDPKKRAQWINEKYMKAFCLINDTNKPATKVDLLISTPLNFKEAYNRRRIERLSSGVEVPVASLEDMLVLKKHAGRAIDLPDILVLEKFILRRKDD